MTRNADGDDVAERDPMEPLRSPEEARRLVLAIVHEHADELLKVARRYSLCADDAQDVFQRTMEVLLQHAQRLDADRAYKWAFTCCKREAFRVRRFRQRTLPREAVDYDWQVPSREPAPEERVMAYERLTRAAEAMRGLKPQEIRALAQQAHGLSYREIAEVNGWTYTKVNRCLTEGRRAFLTRYGGIEAGEACGQWLPIVSALVDGEAAAGDVAALRSHLRTCGACRGALKALRESRASLGALVPLPAALAVAADPGGATGVLASRVSCAAGRAWEALTGPLQERAAASAVKLQAAVETATAGKMAAVAAGAAALAGGGVAVQHTSRDRPAAPPVTASSSRSATAAPAARAGRAAATRARRPAPAAASSTAPRSEFAALISAAAAREFGLSGARASAAPAGGRAPNAPAAAREFAGDRGASGAPAASAPSAEFAADPPAGARDPATVPPPSGGEFSASTVPDPADGAAATRSSGGGPAAGEKPQAAAAAASGAREFGPRARRP